MLQVLQKIISESERLGLACSLCGEMAGDPMGALLLAGMGYRTLSMNSRSVARIKYLLRNVALNEAQGLAERVIGAQNSIEVRHQVAAFMEWRGLGGLIRGGR